MGHNEEEYTVALWIKSETEKAYLVCNDPEGLEDAKTWWVPKSQMRRVSKQKRDGELTAITFTLPHWLMKEKDLWEYEV